MFIDPAALETRSTPRRRSFARGMEFQVTLWLLRIFLCKYKETKRTVSCVYEIPDTVRSSVNQKNPEMSPLL